MFLANNENLTRRVSIMFILYTWTVNDTTNKFNRYNESYYNARIISIVKIQMLSIGIDFVVYTVVDKCTNVNKAANSLVHVYFNVVLHNIFRNDGFDLNNFRSNKILVLIGYPRFRVKIIHSHKRIQWEQNIKITINQIYSDCN